MLENKNLRNQFPFLGEDRVCGDVKGKDRKEESTSWKLTFTKSNKESPLTTQIYFNLLLYRKIKEVLGRLK